MNAMLDAALAWLLWTGVWWAALALGMALWFRWRPPQTAAARHAALAAAIVAGTLAGLLPKWGNGVVTAPQTATPQPLALTAMVEMGVVRDPLLAPQDTTSREEGAGNLAARSPVVVPVKVAEPSPLPMVWNWPSLGKSLVADAWLAGALLLSVRLLRAARITVRWRREAQPLPAGELAVFAALRQELRVQRATRAGSHEEPASPLVLCGWPPLVLVPSDWPMWDENSRCAAWGHELAHVRRRDDWWRIFSETLRVVWWFHPGVRWLLLRREHEAELLSDEAAVAAGCPPQELAQVLLDACRRPHSAAWPAPAATFFSPRTMKLRITRLLEAPSAEALCRPAPRGLWLAAFAGMALLALAGSMRWIAAANEANAAPPATVRVVGRVVDAETGSPINQVGWQTGTFNPPWFAGENVWPRRAPTHETLQDGNFDQTIDWNRNERRRVLAVGYEPQSLLDELPNPLPEPPVIERTVRLVKGREATGTVWNHRGEPAPNAKVFFIPVKSGEWTNITEGIAGAAADRPPDAKTAVADPYRYETVADAQGKFTLPFGRRTGRLAVSTREIDCWAFELPPEGQPAELKLPEPGLLRVDLSHWLLLDAAAAPAAPAFGKDGPTHVSLWIRRMNELGAAWTECHNLRSLLVPARNPGPRDADGGLVAGKFRNVYVEANLEIPLPPNGVQDSYDLFVLRGGKWTDGHYFNVKAGQTTTLDMRRAKGAAVRGNVTMPTGVAFARQPGEAPRRLDWTVPVFGEVGIVPIDREFPKEVVAIQRDGSFRMDAHLPPGKYLARASVQLPFADHGSYGPGTPLSMPDWASNGVEFVIPEPPNDPAGPQPVQVELKMPNDNPRFVAAALAVVPPNSLDRPKQEAAPMKERPNYVKVVGQLLDADTGKPIEKASWECGLASLAKPAEVAWGHSKTLGGTYPDGKFEQLVHFTPDGRFDRLRVYAAGYETTIVVDELPNPRPLQVQRIMRLKRGRTVTGTLRDHQGKPVANGWVFFIPAGHSSNIVEGIPGTDAHQLPSEPRDGAVAEARTNTDGQFVLSAGSAGTLAASTDAVDLWPFPLPDDGHAELTMPAPAHLVIDLTYWYLDELAKKGKRAFSPNSEDPNQCWIQVDRPGEFNGSWKGLEYRRQMFVFALDPRAKLSKGVSVGQVIEGEWDRSIPDVGHNKNTSAKIRIALPPGNYRVQRLRSGPFAPVDERIVELKPGAETTMHWGRGDGSAVRGMAKWPANMKFVRQPGEEPRKLDWTVPDTATVTIANAEGNAIEAARIQADGSFFVATHLDPGKYKVTATVYMPEGDFFRGGIRGADVVATQELVIPDPVKGPSGSSPANVELAMHVGEPRFVPAEAPPVDTSKAAAPPMKEKDNADRAHQLTGSAIGHGHRPLDSTHGRSPRSG